MYQKVQTKVCKNKYLSGKYKKEYLDVLAALPKGNQALDDSDPNNFVAQMGAEAIYTLLKLSLIHI